MTPLCNPGFEDASGGMPESFDTTHWSVVQAAGRNSSTGSRRALEELCRSYWYPLYAYVRRQGNNPEDAQDLTQEFFSRFLEKESVKLADRDRGRFRTFLLTSLKHFLVNEWAKRRAAKRGGGQVFSLDEEAAETRYGFEPADNLTPEKLYDKNWAEALLERVAARLREEYTRFGKLSQFEHLKDLLRGEKSDVPYAELARQMAMSEGALKVAVHRLRHRYQEMLHAEIAETVATPAEVEDELRYLVEVISG
jgi:RNA polymerase sigma factor (sigma-70 family)